jgi:ribosome-associated protein
MTLSQSPFFDENRILHEVILRATRSSGKGGQNVNKVSSKVEVRFPLHTSTALTDAQKTIILYKLKNRINLDGEIVLSAQDDRSQLQNKRIVIAKLFDLLNKALKPIKKRIPVKPSLAKVRKRLNEKKEQAVKKENRSYKADLSSE